MRLLSCLALACLTTTVVVAADEFKLESGFKLLFNGKNFDGWQHKGAKKDDKTAILEGKDDAFAGRYKITDGEIVIDYKVKGDKYIETVQQFSGDFTIRYDFKPGEGCNNDTLLLGTKFDILAGGKLKGVKDGEWNKMEIVAKGGSVDFIVNGEKLATQKTKSDKGPLILRAEFGQITYKNIRATETK